MVDRDFERNRRRDALASFVVMAGVLFAAIALLGFTLLAGRTSTTASSSASVATADVPTATASTPTPSPSSIIVDELSGVDTNSLQFTGKAADFVCHTPTAKKPTVGPITGRHLVTARAQWVLDKLTFDAGPVDGVYNARTIAAIKTLQGQSGLRGDGVINARTWNAIEQSFCQGPVLPLPDGAVLLTEDPTSAEFTANAHLLLCSSADLPAATPSTSRAWGTLLVQYALNQYLGQSIAIDGIFAPTTSDAVRQYQGSHGLAADGAVGPATWAQVRVDACNGVGG